VPLAGAHLRRNRRIAAAPLGAGEVERRRPIHLVIVRVGEADRPLKGDGGL
jgi:hypothetical protein